MRRSFKRLHASLRPDAVIFLGDLLDGGRTTFGKTFDKNKGRFFERVFITLVRLYVAGNHDVGFGDKLVRPSMVRYKRIFGSVNYEIKIGNHSLVVLDTLALSSELPDIRQESQQFLSQLMNETPTLPRILFTHIPLYRIETTPCGAARETKQLILDRMGEQYQNMIHAPLTQEILQGIQPDMVFSGDDHDWCEVAHAYKNSNVKSRGNSNKHYSYTPEVTLPTFSFAQGI
ncbi:Metallo-dependent phosphatase-like protein, partial [Lobosporangium transversale]